MRNQRYITVIGILLLLSVLLSGCAETLNSSENESTTGETTVLYEETIEYEEETTAFKEETITHPLIFVPEYYFDSYLPGVVPPSEAVKKEISDAYRAQWGKKCPLFDTPAFYFGLLQGYYVFWQAGDDLCYEKEKIAGYTFTWSSSVTICVYHNGAFSKLEDLYANGEVSEAFVGEVHARYTALCAAKEENFANNEACRHAVEQARLQAFLAAYRSSHPTDENAEIFKDLWNGTRGPLVIASVKSGDGMPTAADVYVYHVVEEEMLTLTEALDAGWLTGDAGWLTEYEYQRLIEMIGE